MAPAHQDDRYLRVTRMLGLAVFAPLLITLALPMAVRIAQHPDPGLTVHRLEVVAVRAGGPADRAGVRSGDVVTEVNGRPVARMLEYYAAAAGVSPHEPVRYTVRRADGLHRLTVPTRGPGQPALIRGYCLWTIGLAFLAFGWWVLLKRNDPVARGFFGLCFVFAFFLLEIPDLDSAAWAWTKEIVRLLLQSLLPAIFLRFFLMFPSAGPGEVRAPARTRLLLLPGLLLFGATLAVLVLHPHPAGSGAETVLELATLVYALSYIAAGLVVFARRALRRDRPIRRTKMLVVLVGLVAGLLPFLAGMLLGQAVPARLAGPLQFLSLSLVLVPSSFALAIMRYGALDRAFVVRASLVYGTLTLLVLAGYVLLVMGLGNVLARVFHVSMQPVLLLVVAASGLAILPLRRAVQDWVDGTFYPARRVHREQLAALAAELAEVLEPDRLVQLLHARLSRLFRPRRLAILLADTPGAPLRRVPLPGDARGGQADASDDLPADGDLARLLQRQRRPLHTEEIEDMLLGAGAEPAALAWLARHGVQLLLPLVSGRRLVGVCAFAAKTGGALYSQDDLAHLRGLALHVASLLENRRLYRDSLRRQRLETELEVARDIQARLLPVAPLTTAAFEVAGRNVPCRGVGGDYFDHFVREDGQLALAIADVAGKGIPAALLMTSLGTAFRREAEARLGPAAIAVALNASLGGRMGPGRFVCFFGAVWDPATGLLRYCNAGMEPPVLFRPGTGWRQRLRKGGPVLGAVPDHPYREGALVLRPGDRLFLHTDGLADQRNEQGDFYDEARLLASVARHGERQPSDALDAVFAAVNRFGGNGESDDMTAMLLLIKRIGDFSADGPLLAQAAGDGVDTRGLPDGQEPLKAPRPATDP